MTLGSLFDGSGGFPLAGALNGFIPVWASEIEPYPLRVTSLRFPQMEQLGNIMDVDGALAEPVDVITFGSPCQDLSVAGKQTGIHDGKRSSLFFEAVRIVREMRGITNGKYPRFAVCENVPGAFSSNRGADFRAVLQALCEIADPDAAVPEPPKGKWAKVGCVVGDGYSIAWRVYDAQYWGVPQRRKRIYLVADFGSERAGEILFEREGVRGDSSKSGEAWGGAADDAAGGAGGGCYAFDITGVNSNSMKSPAHDNCFRECQVSRSLDTFSESPECNQGGTCVVFPEIVRTLAARHDSSLCVDRGQNVVALDCRNLIGNAAGFNDSLGEQASGGMEYSEECAPTLRAGDVRAVVYGCRGNRSGDIVPNLTGDHQNRVTDYTAICVGNGQMHQTELGDKTGALNCMHDQQAVIHSANPPRRYIVRRLTPLECCRLQGFPDWWEDGANGSDSARYKMWGNGIALPCAEDVMRRIAKEMNHDGTKPD